ncbi:MAG: nucleoside-diphosphate sugar epimerase, partial [Pseudomonadota bacterium]|nr:nucleoside-diphosphate sugar epimerase [Pseudomonadota bacterium]
LATLLRLADTPWPLPFASLLALRSYVHVDDLARLLIACAENPQAAGRTYIGAHAHGVSAAALVSAMRSALGRAARLYPFPAKAIEACAAAVGQGDKARRLTRGLVGDPEAAERELGWVARVPVDQVIGEMVRDYRARVRQ